ncbi:type II secretion system protein GspG [Escherichia coli]|nr:type II secretion system protein GspG [Escherichia coli]
MDTLNDCQKDPWGNDYQYLSPGEKGLFDVYTLGGGWSGKRGKALAQISVTGICRSFSKQCLNADSLFWKSCW